MEGRGSPGHSGVEKKNKRKCQLHKPFETAKINKKKNTEKIIRKIM